MSYSLWRSLKPAIGYENWHCQTKRGFEKARNKEPEVQRLLSEDNQPQKIGKLAQRGVFEFHQEPVRLSGSHGVEQVAKILQLNQESPEIQARVLVILNNYYQQPILLNKKILNIRNICFSVKIYSSSKPNRSIFLLKIILNSSLYHLNICHIVLTENVIIVFVNNNEPSYILIKYNDANKCDHILIVSLCHTNGINKQSINDFGSLK